MLFKICGQIVKSLRARPEGYDSQNLRVRPTAIFFPRRGLSGCGSGGSLVVRRLRSNIPTPTTALGES
jgi:hypothetical protein